MVALGKNAPMGAVRRSFLLSPQNLLSYYWLLLVLAGVYALTGGGNTPNYAWWAVLALSACGLPLLVVHRSPGSFVVLMALCHAVYYPVAVLFNLLASSPGVYEEPIWLRTPQAMLLCSVGMLGFALGAYFVNFLPKRRKSQTLNARPKAIAPVSRIRLLALSAMVIPYAISLYFTNTYFHMSAAGDTGWNPESADRFAWVGYLEYVPYAALFIQLRQWFITRSKNDAIFALICIALPILTFLPSGSRDQILRGVVPTIALASLSFIRIRPLHAMLMTLVVATLLWHAIIGIEIYRNQIRYDGVVVSGMRERFNLIRQSLAQANPFAEKQVADAQIQMMGRRLADYVVPAMATGYFPEIEPFRGVEGTKNWVPFLLPHQLRPAEYQVDPREGAELSKRIGFKGGTLAIYDPTSEGSSPPMIIGDWYSRFGWTGVFFGMIICGVFLRIIDLWVSSPTLFRSICLGLLILPVMKLSHQSLFVWFMFFTRAFVITLILAAAIKLFLSVYFRRARTVVANSNEPASALGSNA